MNLTKKMITELGNKVVELCQRNGYGDTAIYFDGKRIRLDSSKFILVIILTTTIAIISSVCPLRESCMMR